MGRWCECGLATNDPLHGAWCKVWSWNQGVFERARAQREAEFEAEHETHQHRHGRRPSDPQPGLDIVYGPGGKTYSR